jgi:hypothetical protein
MIWRCRPWFGSAWSSSEHSGLARSSLVLRTQIWDDLTYLRTKFKGKTSSCIQINMVCYTKFSWQNHRDCTTAHFHHALGYLKWKWFNNLSVFWHTNVTTGTFICSYPFSVLCVLLCILSITHPYLRPIHRRKY